MAEPQEPRSAATGYPYTAYTWKQAAERLGVPVTRIPAMIARGALVSLDHGFVTTDSVERDRIHQEERSRRRA